MGDFTDAFDRALGAANPPSPNPGGATYLNDPKNRAAIMADAARIAALKPGSQSAGAPATQAAAPAQSSSGSFLGAFDRALSSAPQQPQLSQAAPVSPNNVAGRAAAGAALGVADIGNTVLNGLAYLPGKIIPAVAQWNRTRNADFDALTEANKDSTAFKLGRVAGNVAATAPVGGALGAGAEVAGAGNSLVAALTSGGMRVGGATGARALGLRAVGGAATGAASAGLIDPSNAGTGAVIGAALPGAVKLSGIAGDAVAQGSNALARRLMQSAVKPTIKQLKTGDAATAVNALLDYGISPNEAGVNKLRGLIDGLNSQVADKIQNSNAVIDKNAVVGRLNDVRQMFGSQVSPTADLNAIQGVADDFMSHPNYPGATIPVQDAQAMKQGTYQVLAKKYGQMGSADTEAQKGLARGLKEEIAGAVPEVAGLNAEESRLLTTLSVTERRALMEMNKNPMGLASLAKNPLGWAAFMADRSASFKALAARMVNTSGSMGSSLTPALESGLSNPLLRGGAVQLPAPSSQR